MIQPTDHICPLCGLIFTTWTDFHRHVARMHEKKEKEPRAERRLLVHPDDVNLAQQVLSGTWNGELAE